MAAATTAQELTKAEVLDRLRGLVGFGRTQADIAREAGISRAWVNKVLNGRQAPAPAMLRLAGIERRIETRVVYVLTNGAGAHGMERDAGTQQPSEGTDNEQ